MLVDVIESAGKTTIYAVIVAALFSALLIIVNDDKCEALQGAWDDQCRNIAQTTEWGVKAIETASDVQPWIKQAKSAWDAP